MKQLATALTILLFIITYLAYNTMAQKKTLYIYMWSDYIHPEVIEEFQKKYNCWVVVDCYDSNESMYTKLLLGASGYDVVFPSNYFLHVMAKKGMLLDINPDFIENSRYIDRPFLEQRIHLPKTPYGIPYMVSFSGIAWRNDSIHPEPLSWNIFSDTKLRGRMTLLNDMRETLGMGLLYLGYSANSESAAEIHEAKELIISSFRPNIAKFESEQYKNGIAGGEYLVVHGYSGDSLQIMSENKKVSFGYPKEGSLVCVDYTAILSSSKEKELAHSFLNFLLEPEVVRKNCIFTQSRSPHTEVRTLLPEELKNSPILYPEDASNQIFECILPVDRARKEYISAWDDIKAGK